MKIALYFSLALTLAASANDIQRLPKESIAVSPLAGEVLQVSPMCPKGFVCKVDGTLIHVKFVLGGCIDQMTKVLKMYDQVSKRLYISALNIHVKSSMNARCLEAPVKVERVTLPDVFDAEEVVFLGTDKTESLLNK